MGETERNLQAALAKLTELSMKGIGKAKESITHSSQMVKGRIELTSLQKDRRRTLALLGEEVLKAIKADKLQTTLFDDQIVSLDELDAKIAKKTAELNQTGAGAEESEALEEEEDEEKEEK